MPAGPANEARRPFLMAQVAWVVPLRHDFDMHADGFDFFPWSWFDGSLRASELCEQSHMSILRENESRDSVDPLHKPSPARMDMRNQDSMPTGKSKATAIAVYCRDVWSLSGDCARSSVSRDVDGQGAWLHSVGHFLGYVVGRAQGAGNDDDVVGALEDVNFGEAPRRDECERLVADAGDGLGAAQAGVVEVVLAGATVFGLGSMAPPSLPRA